MKYEKDGHIIHCADCMDVLSSISDESVDLIFADPPYNIGKKFGQFSDTWPSEEAYIDWSTKWLDQCIRVLKKDGSFYVMTSTQAMPYFDIYIRQRLHILSRIVWSYDSSGVQAKKYYGSMYEPILFAVKDRSFYKFNANDILVQAKTGAVRKLIDYRGGTPKQYNTLKVPGNVWDMPRVRYRMGEYEDHPSQKPEMLLSRIIRASTNEGDTVLDPFSGTFTTSAVAKSLNRKSIGIELNTEYVKVGLRRVLAFEALDGQSLQPSRKSTARKNFNGIKGLDPMEAGGDLFSADI